MRLLLDTNILIALARRQLDARIGSVFQSPDNVSFASAASLWEIAIKTRLGKLDPGLGLDDLAGYYESVGLTLLAVDHRHAVRWVDPEPATCDPFDRLLLAQCAVEDMRLITLDRALARHPLAWRAT
jgi:PIN domain nuclease of toxin-antitoxin system